MPKTKSTSTTELAALKSQLSEATQGWQRTQADFDNFRRRTQAEQQDRAATEVGRALQALTPVAENLRRAVSDLETLKPETALVDQLRSWATGVQSIARQLDQALSAAGLTPIDPQPGEPFNPHEHEALTHQPHENHAADTVSSVIERGYKVGTRVLNPAKVTVSSGPRTTE